MSADGHKDAAQAVMAYLSERKSEAGRTYFTGWAGHCRLLMFKTGDLDKYDNPVWRLIVQEGEVKPGTFHKAPDATGEQQAAPVSMPGPASDPKPKPRSAPVDHSGGLDDDLPL